MAFLKWDDSFSVNVAEIDDQHKKLFDMINEFYQSVKDDNKQALRKLIAAMADYTRFHFSTEEKYFDRFMYQETDEHKAEHRKFAEKVMDVKARIDSGKLVVSFEVTNYLKDWLTNHIKGTDKKYTPFFNKHGLL